MGQNYQSSNRAKMPYPLDDFATEENSLLKVTNQPDGSKNIEYYLINEIEDIEDYIDFLRALGDCHPADTVDMHINCFGGAMYAGYHIFDALLDCPATINMHVDGFCCSAASTILMAGDNFDFAPHSCVMVHAMTSLVGGKWHEIKAQLKFDEKWFAETAREVYEGFMTEEEIEGLYRIQKEMPVGAPCTYCRYCLDACPQNLKIPKILSIYNDDQFTGNEFTTFLSVRGLPEGKRPMDCIQCRACEDACPQGIKISEIFKAFTDRLVNSTNPRNPFKK